MMDIILGYLNGENIQACGKNLPISEAKNPTALNSELAENRYLHTSALNYRKIDMPNSLSSPNTWNLWLTYTIILPNDKLIFEYENNSLILT